MPDELKVVGKPFSEEPYGIGVPRGDNALRFAARRRPRRPREERRLEEGVRRDPRPVRGARAEAARRSTATRRAEERTDRWTYSTDNFSLYGEGFLGTVELTVYASLLALVLGFLMASFRVAPVGSLRAFGTAWVTVLRNTPLTLLFFAVLLGLPRFGLVLPFKLFAVLALGCYTSAFICEALRSGINTVPDGPGRGGPQPRA